MFRGEQLNTEVDDIWHEKGKYRGTLQSRQLQMATERDSLVGITDENGVCSLKNTHFPHLVMHLSIEDVILSQMDLIWENYIVSAYNSHYSDDSWPLSLVTNDNNCSYFAREFSASGPHILYEHSRELCKTSAGDLGFSTICNGIFTQKQGQVKEIIWKSYVQGANLWRKRKLSTQLDGAENEAKRSMNINKCGDSLHYLMDFNANANIDFIASTTKDTKDQDRFVKPHHEIEASLEKDTSVSILINAQETCRNVKLASKMLHDGCYFGSVLKSLVISSSSLGVTEEVFSSTFIPQSDSSVDYTTLCGSLQQKGRCKVPADSDEILCLTNNTDSNINLHVRLSLHPCILTSDVILGNVNCTDPGERQGQNCINWAAREWRKIHNEIATLKSFRKNKSSSFCIDKKNHHCGNSDKSFSTRLNYPRRLEKQHFVQDISFSILAASKNNFSASRSSALRTTSRKESSHEVEISLGTKNINISPGRAHPDGRTALNKQDFCFPSHFQNEVDTEQSEKATSGNNVDFYMDLKHVSYTERFQKICLEKFLEESESSNSKEIYCSFPNEMLFCKSRSTQGNVTTMQYMPSECESKSQNIKQEHKQQSCTKDAENKERNEEVLSGYMNSDATQSQIVGDSTICEKVMEEVEEMDMTFDNLDGIEEENRHMNYALDEFFNRSSVSSVSTETVVSENCKQECDTMEGIKMEASLAVTKESTDASSAGNKVLLKNTDFEMKAQFDLVLEELKMFHTIEEEKVENVKTELFNRVEHTSSNAKELQNGIKENVSGNKVLVGGDSEVLVTEKDYTCDRKTFEVNEQEVPQQCVSSYPGDEESLYSADNVGDVPKSLSWTSVFLKSNNREENITSQNEKAVTFSHGIGRVTPLKTRTGPLRIGLSKKAKIKQLHPYLR